MSKSVIFKRMWEIIRDTAKKVGCLVKEVSKSEALKMAYEPESNFQVEQEKAEPKNISLPLGAKKIGVGKAEMFTGKRRPTFENIYSIIRKFDVIYVEKSRDVYAYYFINENYELELLTESHFGFMQTAIWETMLLNYEKRTQLADDWELFFANMEKQFSF